MENILPIELRVKSYDLWEKQWLLLTSGDYATGKYNCMTVAWGSIGSMWSKPFVQVVVRPTRYTFEFITKYPDFTVCAFPKEYRAALGILGAKSGRDGDKIAAAGLTPCKSSNVAASAFQEANLIIECRKIYQDVFKPESFIDPGIHNSYSEKDYHAVFYGEILAINGDRALYT